MSFFKRLAKAAAPVDDLAGDANGQRFRAELAEGRWQGLHDFLEATREWDSRDFYIARLSDISGRPGWLNEWAAARPTSSLPFLFRGTQGMHWAWQARGSGYAKTVQRDAWQVFYARLVEADRDLAKAAAVDEEDPTPTRGVSGPLTGLASGLMRRKGGSLRRRAGIAGMWARIRT
ncbi:MAG TPA: hypothetical protein VHZ03_53505 [Trebonia sp.]|nr:hypothetical protein [Trebonia sp.]